MENEKTVKNLTNGHKKLICIKWVKHVIFLENKLSTCHLYNRVRN